MSKLAKALSSAAGNAGGDKLYVEDVFSTYLYEGNDGTQTITTGIDILGEGGLIWQKPRTTDSADSNHKLFDTARGQNKVLYTNRTTAQETGRPLTYTSTGFTLDAGSSYYGFNKTGVNYCSWTFRKAPGFFDVVTYTGTGATQHDVTHNLGTVPGFVIVKDTSSSGSWSVGALKADGSYAGLILNTTGAASPASVAAVNAGIFDTHVDFGNTGWSGQIASVNVIGNTYVAYLFAHDAQVFGADADESVIKCGSFTTTGSDDVSLGWEAQYVMLKRSDGTSAWYIWDTMRGMPVAATTNYFSANTSAAEAVTAAVGVYPTADGFHQEFFGAGQDLIYIAIRRPMKVPESGTEVYNGVLQSASNSARTISGAGFSPDLLFQPALQYGNGTAVASRLADENRYLYAYSANAEAASASGTEFTMDGIMYGSSGGPLNSNGLALNLFLKRAPGFMDVVAYTGTGSATTQAHNLGAVPELMIVKCRSEANQFWAVYAGDPTDFLQLNTTAASGDLASVWNDTSPTSGVFTVGTRDEVNGSAKTYIAYLFATLAGVSKVGSYTGAGAYSLNLDMGFTGGARLFLVKRTDATGDWYLYNSTRGISAGNDPYLLLNSGAIEVTNTDYVDPLAAGITLTAAGSSTINVSGGSYIFLAIA